MLCFVSVLHGCVGYVCCYARKTALLQFLQLLRGTIVCVFVGFWDRDYVNQLPCVRYYVFVKSSFKHTREDASLRGHMCFRCLIFSL